jgi:hypothetical protein
MRKRLSAALYIACAGLFVVALLVLAIGFVSGGSAGGTLATGRSVQATSDSWQLSSQFSADTATIDTAGYTIVVAPAHLQVDGQTIAPLHPAAKAVTVHVEDGTITFTADGTSVATYPPRTAAR